jgi:hypothetical protein
LLNSHRKHTLYTKPPYFPSQIKCTLAYEQDTVKPETIFFLIFQGPKILANLAISIIRRIIIIVIGVIIIFNTTINLISDPQTEYSIDSGLKTEYSFFGITGPIKIYWLENLVA